MQRSPGMIFGWLVLSLAMMSVEASAGWGRRQSGGQAAGTTTNQRGVGQAVQLASKAPGIPRIPGMQIKGMPRVPGMPGLPGVGSLPGLLGKLR